MCLSPNPPMQWLPSLAVLQVRGAGPTQPAAGRGQWGVGRDIRVTAHLGHNSCQSLISRL